MLLLWLLFQGKKKKKIAHLEEDESSLCLVFYMGTFNSSCFSFSKFLCTKLTQSFCVYFLTIRTVLSYDGSMFMKIQLPVVMHTEAEDVPSGSRPSVHLWRSHGNHLQRLSRHPPPGAGRPGRVKLWST